MAVMNFKTIIDKKCSEMLRGKDFVPVFTPKIAELIKLVECKVTVACFGVGWQDFCPFLQEKNERGS